MILKITALRSRARIALLAIFHHSFPAPSCGSESRARARQGRMGALLGTNIAHFRSLRLLAQHVLREPTKQSMTDSHLSCRLCSTFSPLCLRTNETAARNNPLPPPGSSFPRLSGQPANQRSVNVSKTPSRSPPDPRFQITGRSTLASDGGPARCSHSLGSPCGRLQPLVGWIPAGKGP